MCRDVGWQGINVGACDVLTDLLSRYIHTLGKTASVFAEHDSHTVPHLKDICNTFQELGITTDGLEEYIANVNLGVALEKRPPSLPIPCPQTHIFDGDDIRVLRKEKTMFGDDADNEDKMEQETVQLATEGKEGVDSMEVTEELKGKEEEESDEEEWEEIPGYLPPFPKPDKDKTGDKEDAESGIGLPEEEGLATPSSLMSPSLGTQGLPMLVYQRSVTSEDSRRSSASDETMATQEPSDITPQETLPPTLSEPQPLVPVTLSHSEPVISPAMSSSSERSIREKPPTSVALKSPPEEYLPPKPLTKGDIQRRGIKLKPKLTLPIHPHTDISPTGNLESPRMPQLRPLTPTPLPGGIVPSMLPSLSPLTKTPPTSPLVTKSSRPQLHPLTTVTSPTYKGGSITSTTTVAAQSSRPIKELKVRLTKLPSPIPFSPPPQTVPLQVAPPIKPPLLVAPPPTPPPHSPSPESHHEETKSLSPAKGDYEQDFSLSPTSADSPLSTSSHTPQDEPPSAGSEELQVPSPHFDTPSPIIDSPFPPQDAPPTQEVRVTPTRPPTDDMYISSSSTSTLSSSLPLTPEALPSQPYMSPISKPLTPPQRSPSPVPLTPPSHVPLTPAKYDAYSPRAREPFKHKERQHTFPSPANPWVERDALFPPSFSKKQKMSPLTDDVEEDDTTSESSLESHPPTPQDKMILKKRSPTIKLTKVTLPSPHPSPHPLSSVSPEDVSSLTVTIPKFTAMTSIRPSAEKTSLARPSSSTDNLLIVSSKYEAVDSIHPKVSKLPSPVAPPPISLTFKSPSPVLLMKGLSPKPLTLVVTVKRRHLLYGSAALSTPSPLSAEGVKVTIPKSMLLGSTALGAKGQKGHDSGKSKGKVKKAKKRMIQHELTPDPKKIKLHSPSPLIMSGSCSDEDSIRSHTRLKGKSRSLRSSEESDSKGELKIRLKLNQTTTTPPIAEPKISKKSKGVKKSIAAIGASPLAMLSSSPRDSLGTPPTGKSESLIITSSAPKPVPSIKLQKVSVPLPAARGGAGKDDDPEVYICPLCQKPDDGTPMICCDYCDIWLHMRCVGVTMAPPDDQQWYCPTCSRSSKKKKSKKKKH